MFRKILVTLTGLLAIVSLTAQINTDQVLQIGRNALYFEDYMLSIQYFNQVIQAKPYLAKPYLFRAIAKLNLDDFKGAEEDASLAIERNPFITDAYEVRAVARQNMGNPGDAITDYDVALSRLPDNRGILFNKTIALEELKRYDEALESYNSLIAKHPGFDNAYVGRARLYLTTGDTIRAVEDLDKAIGLNRNSVNAYVLRADISIKSEKNFQRALDDMNEAIKLQPHYSGFFVNRAFLRYNLDDYFGAMADYDYAISLDPVNPVAYFNRGLLRAEVHDRDRAIADFSKVLEFDPNDYRSLFNRANLYRETRNYPKAIADISRVVDAFPDFDGALFTRFQIYDEMGDKVNAQRDYNKALSLSKSNLAKAEKRKQDGEDNESSENGDENIGNKTEPDELVTRRFTSLLTIENEHELDREYNNKSIRGRVQDRDVAVKLRPLFVASYYATTNQLKETPYYIKEVDDINSTRILRFVMMVTSDDVVLTDPDDIQRHFNSIEYYNSFIPTHQQRSVDYFGRGMDFMTIRNYTKAIEDFTRAIDLTPDFALAYFMRGAARYHQLLIEKDDAPQRADSPDAFIGSYEKMKAGIKGIVNDYDKVIELTPNNPFAFFNKAVILAESGDNTSALSALCSAIELKPDFGEAYYNRGYIYMQLGQREKGMADLSKAGELGVMSSYNLLKRMNR